MRVFKQAMLAVAVALAGVGSSQMAWAQDAACQLKYPIVLSHHWAMRKICPDAAPATGAASCVQAEDYQKYCVAKGQDAQGRKTCGQWRVTPAEEALPPRNVNAVDPSLTRDLASYHRYFSAEVVARLAQTCGNKVYIADKPAQASYEVRARSLRNTVQQALAAENASKVILIGISQGVQDARYMTALLPVDDADAAQGRMRDKVAAVVSLVGEDGGAESAGQALEVMHLLTNGRWADRAKVTPWKESDANDMTWQRKVNGQTTYVLGEQCRGPECNLSLDDRYRWSVHALFNLSPRYMRPPSIQVGMNAPLHWHILRDFVGSTESDWASIIPPSLEANNGVQYLSYGARIQVWHNGWGDLVGPEFLLFSTMAMQGLPNDGYVSLPRQLYANPAPNFSHIKTLSGSIFNRGYHHMFFTGRNDALYMPPTGSREAAPYQGKAADFYQQLARDLKARGL